jgi:hypothetical protein
MNDFDRVMHEQRNAQSIVDALLADPDGQVAEA